MAHPARVLIIDDEPTTAAQLAQFLSERSYEVATASGVSHARDVLSEWRPHVLVLVPTLDEARHGELEELRRAYPRVPVVVVTHEIGTDVLLDVEAFAPALPARPERGLGHIASAVAAAIA